jgi:hypothetical protein
MLSYALEILDQIALDTISKVFQENLYGTVEDASYLDKQHRMRRV